MWRDLNEDVLEALRERAEEAGVLTAADVVELWPEAAEDLEAAFAPALPAQGQPAVPASRAGYAGADGPSMNPTMAAATESGWVKATSCRAPGTSTVCPPGISPAVARCREGGISWSREGITQRTGTPSFPTHSRESNRARAKPASWWSSSSRESSVSHSQAECSGGIAPVCSR